NFLDSEPGVTKKRYLWGWLCLMRAGYDHRNEKDNRVKKLTLFYCMIVSCMFSELKSQSFHWELDEAKGYEVPIGIGAWEEIASGDYYPEMEKYYAEYDIDMEAIREIDDVKIADLELSGLAVDIYFGAWCGDSKELLPHFLKITENSTLLEKVNMTYIGCDRNKKAGDIDIAGANIEFVPTFLFKKNGVEVGRIVESPSETLELDILRILKNIE
ncbi:thioredoxin family protein, partial [Bacteroidales bacterium OttesenSCG-928-A14]|nr:thioredoxin family protein [Bacteroidales bacterium OttesenSCG-928-A14]